MDQIKIGKFIVECRKKQKLTQLQLAEKLNITDRAVSKWENGKAMPDSMIMLKLCEVLGITINDLLSGEIVKEKQSDTKTQENLLAIVKQKECLSKQLFMAEWMVAILAIIPCIALAMVAAYVDMAEWLRIVLIIGGVMFCFVGCLFALRIEQVAGYYQCRHCRHRYVPTFGQVNLAMHIGRKRYLKCPSCNKYSWNKKVISKDE